MVAQDVRNLMAASLDAEGSERYHDTRDYIPAINFAQYAIINYIDRTLGAKKFGEQALRKLRLTRIYETNQYGRVAISDAIISIEAVYPKCTFIGTKSADPGVASASRALPELAFLAAPYGSANRLSDEEWADNYENPLSQGYSLETDRANHTYAYRQMIDYGSNVDYNPTNAEWLEIEIRPVLNKDVAAITFIEKPITIQALQDALQFPDNLLTLFEQVALIHITMKESSTMELMYQKAAALIMSYISDHYGG